MVRTLIVAKLAEERDDRGGPVHCRWAIEFVSRAAGRLKRGPDHCFPAVVRTAQKCICIRYVLRGACLGQQAYHVHVFPLARKAECGPSSLTVLEEDPQVHGGAGGNQDLEGRGARIMKEAGRERRKTVRYQSVRKIVSQRLRSA